MVMPTDQGAHPRGRAAVWGLQIGIAAIVVLFAWQTLAERWNEFRAIELDLTWRPGWIVMAATLVLATYGLLVYAWRRVLAGWGQEMRFPVAVRIWTLSNLGRYVPGKVWSIAGLAVLAQRSGVAGWAAAGAALALQAIAVGTGVAVVAATAPGALSATWLALGAVIALGTVTLLSWPPSVRVLGRMAGRTDLTPLPFTALAVATIVTALSWVVYGLAFWGLARGLLGEGAEGFRLATAVGTFAGGYIVGLLALFAPGGIGVREVVFLGLLTPPLGAGGAVALAAGSRVLLTLTEIGAALVGLLIRHHSKEQGIA